MVSSVAGFIVYLLFLVVVVVTLPLPITLPILVNLELIKLESKRGRPPHSIHILGVFRERNASASFAAVSASVD